MGDAELTIVVDVGNSGAKIGAVRGEDVAGPKRLDEATGRGVRREAEPLLQGGEGRFVVFGSQPGKVKDLAWEIGKLRMGPCVAVGPEHPGLPRARVEHPERAGVDRRVQVLGAASIAGGAVVVIGCGTALTVDLGDADGALLGGAILPGLTLGMRALAAGTARLPVVTLEGPVGMPARDTETAIRTGILLGAAGAIGHLLAEAGRADVPVFLTGQDAGLLVERLGRPVRRHPGLGLLGAAVAARTRGGETFR
jgi:pantothenate kinase type III